MYSGVNSMGKIGFGCKATKQRELKSLLGLLQHLAKVVSPGRISVRRIIQGSHRCEAQRSLCKIGGRNKVRFVMVAQVSRQVE